MKLTINHLFSLFFILLGLVILAFLLKYEVLDKQVPKVSRTPFDHYVQYCSDVNKNRIREDKAEQLFKYCIELLERNTTSVSECTKASVSIHPSADVKLVEPITTFYYLDQCSFKVPKEKLNGNYNDSIKQP